MEQSSRFGSTYALAGWLFAELLFVLSILFLASNTVGVQQQGPSARQTEEAMARAATVLAGRLPIDETEVAAIIETRDAFATQEAKSRSTAEAAMATSEALVAEQTTAAELLVDRDQALAAAATTEVALAVTAEAAATTSASLARTATAIARPTQVVTEPPTPTLVALNPNFETLTITVDADNLLAGNEQALADAESEIDRVLSPFGSDCVAGIVLTFGHGSAQDSAQIARIINSILLASSPSLFEQAAFEDFIDLSPPRGQVDVRVYFLGACSTSP